VGQAPILVINAGSSTIKFAVFQTAADRSLSQDVHGQVDGIGTSARLTVGDARGGKLAEQPVTGASHEDAIKAIQQWFASHVGGESGFDGVGHRVVHGGLKYSQPALVDARLLADLEQLLPLAPLHEPHQIAAIRAVSAAAPKVRQVVCFDTAFHHGQPSLAREFALPRELTARGIRRYGFHGLSYEYIVSVLPQIAPACARGKLVVAHLGNGASMCAIDQGRAVCSTMGLTPVDGLPMGTRTGTLDPGVLLFLMQHERMDVHQIEQLIYERSGLLGVSGLSSDMRTLLASDSLAAREAVDLFVYRIGRELGSLVAALGGLDALVFTGGIGENSAEVRGLVLARLGFLGLAEDPEANAQHGRATGGRISPHGPVLALVVPTDEELMIARDTARLVADR
jgi:acetate kinase